MAFCIRKTEALSIDLLNEIGGRSAVPTLTSLVPILPLSENSREISQLTALSEM